MCACAPDPTHEPGFGYPPTVSPTPPRPTQDWRVLVAVFWTVSMVEGLGVSQIFAFIPVYLREMGVAPADRLAFVGLFSSLIFIVGAPLVPLWGVWADKYSRKAVIVRSSLVEAVVFGLVAVAREPWQLALAMLLIGFQLGNTGVMLAGIRDVTPLRRLGFTIAIFGASGPVGFAVGPVLGGIIVDGLGWSLSAVFAVSALLSIGTALLVTFGSQEVRPTVVPEGSVISLAFGAVKGVLSDPAVRRIFAIFGLAFLATQMTPPVHPGPRRGHRRDRAGPRLVHRPRRRHGGPRRGAHLAARRGAWRPDRVPDRADRRAAGRGRRPAHHADRHHHPAPGRGRGPARDVDGGGLRDDLRPAGHRGPTGTPVGDPEPRLPAAVPRRDRSDRRWPGVVVTVIGVSAPFVLGALVFGFGAMVIVALGRGRGGETVSAGV